MAVLGATTLTGCNSIPSFIATGSIMLFEQTSAPTSWTKKTTFNNTALRVTNGTVAPGGSLAFSSAFASRGISGSISVSGTVGATTLATTQIPAHAHPNGASGGTNASAASPISSIANGVVSGTGNAGGGGSHDHPFSGSGSFTGTALDMAVSYVDVILATKD
jgi:hypothetical protein